MIQTCVDIARSVAVGVLAMLSTRHSVGLSAWDVAGYSVGNATLVVAIALVSASDVAGVLAVISA